MGKTQGIRLRSNPPRSAPTRAMRRTSPETACVAKEGAAALSVAGADSIIVGDGSWSACDSISSLEISPDCGDGCALVDELATGRALTREDFVPFERAPREAVPGGAPAAGMRRLTPSPLRLTV